MSDLIPDKVKNDIDNSVETQNLPATEYRGDQFGPANPDLFPDLHKFGEPPRPSTGNIDVAEFVKAQALFLARQTWFLENRSPSDNPAYLGEVLQYSKAQGDYIKALNEVLQQLGVI